MDSVFEIKIRGSRHNKSLQMPAFAVLEGVALQESTTNPGVAELADGTIPAGGFVNRAVAVGVPTPTYAELAGQGASMPLESPYQAGHEGSLEDAEEVEAEGADHILGTGGDAITSSTAIKTRCSFRAGKFCVAQTNQYVEYMLVEKKTPHFAANGTRYRFRKVDSHRI